MMCEFNIPGSRAKRPPYAIMNLVMILIVIKDEMLQKK